MELCDSAPINQSSEWQSRGLAMRHVARCAAEHKWAKTERPLSQLLLQNSWLPPWQTTLTLSLLPPCGSETQPKLFWLVCTGNKFALHCGPENTQPTPGGYFIPCTQKEQQTASLPTLDLSDLLEPRSRLGIHRHITQTRRKRIFVSRES